MISAAILEEKYKISQSARLNKKDRQYQEGLRYVHCFSSRDRNMHLVPQESIALFKDIEMKMKISRERERAHDYEMKVKNDELLKNRRWIEELQEKISQKDREMIQKLMQINASILEIPLKKYAYFLDEGLKLDDCVETVIKNANLVVQEFFRVKDERQHIEIESGPQFMLGGIEESAIAIDSDGFDSQIQFEKEEKLKELEDKIKKLTIENNQLTQQVDKISAKYKEQRRSVDDLKINNQQLKDYTDKIERTATEQLLKIQTLEEQLEHLKKHGIQQKYELPRLTFLKTNNTINSKQSKEDESFIAERNDRELLEKFLTEENAELEKKVQNMEQEMDELKAQHQKEKKDIEESASKLIHYTDSVQNKLVSENEHMVKKLKQVAEIFEQKQVQLKVIQKEIDLYQKNIDELQAKIDELTEQNEKLIEDIEKKDKQTQHSKQIVTQKNEEESSNMRTKISQTDEQHHDLIEKMLGEDIIFLEKKVQSLERQIQVMKHKQMTEKKQMGLSNVKIFEYANAVQDQLVAQKTQSQKLTKQLRDLKQRSDKLEAQFKAEINKLQEEAMTQRKKSEKIAEQLKNTEQTLKDMLQVYKG